MITAPDADGTYRIHVMVPAGDQVSAQWAMSFANMIGYTIAHLGNKITLHTAARIGTYVHTAREDLIRDAEEAGGHYILWCDTDHKFPPDALIRLLAHDKAMVGINYPTRRMPPRYVAIKRTAIEHPGGGKLCETRRDSEGLETVEGLGFGLVLMKMAILPTLPKEGPWFFFEHNDNGKHVGEDVWFCRLVRQAGWEIHVDHDLSKDCTHVGTVEYRLDHIWALQEETEDYHGDYDVQRTADGGGELDEQERPDESDS
jgi:hypothetical protein